MQTNGQGGVELQHNGPKVAETNEISLNEHYAFIASPSRRTSSREAKWWRILGGFEDERFSSRDSWIQTKQKNK